MTWRCALLPLFLLSVCATFAYAQSDTAAKATSRHWRIGGALMLPMGQVVDPTFGAVSITATSAAPLRPGPDLAIAVIPRGIMYGAVLGGARLNLGVPIPVARNVTLVPSAGLTMVGAVAALGVAGGLGGNGTVALHLLDTPEGRPAATHGLRVAITQHVFVRNGSLRMVEVGFIRR